MRGTIPVQLAWAIAISSLFLSACDGGGSPPPDTGAFCSSDAQCDDGLNCNGVERCDPENADANAMGCVAGTPLCDAGETCIEASGTCEPPCDVPRDADSDGFIAMACGGGDCDDNDPNRYPGNIEVCDVLEHDEDCDPRTFGFRDQDSDTAADATCCNVDTDGTRYCGTDCNDNAGSVRPGQVESCNDVDDDCDGSTDEGVLNRFYPDTDGDRFGDRDATPVLACSEPAEHSADGTDCNDGDQTIHGAAVEVCDGVDNNCNGLTDENTGALYYPDVDGDGYGDRDATPVTGCTAPEGHVANALDCDDGEQGVSPVAVETCNGRDDNCDGNTDEGLLVALYPTWTATAPAMIPSPPRCAAPARATSRTPPIATIRTPARALGSRRPATGSTTIATTRPTRRSRSCSTPTPTATDTATRTTPPSSAARLSASRSWATIAMTATR